MSASTGSSGTSTSPTLSSSASSSGGTALNGSSSSGGANGSSSSGGAGAPFAYCPQPTFAIDNGDIGQPCTESVLDGDAGPGSCSAGEICEDYGAGPVCTIVCATGECPGTASCAGFVLANGASPFLCVPSCSLSGGGDCPAGLACSARTPNPADPGTCSAPCTTDASCNAAGATTTWVCGSGGACLCTHDADCSNGALCDAPSGTCYFPCSASDNPGCLVDSYPEGCCASTGAVGYCDYLLPTGGWAGGGLVPDSGFAPVPPVDVENEGINAPCGVPDGGGDSGLCGAGQICEDFGYGFVCTFDCSSTACPGNAGCFIFGDGDRCLASCAASDAGCGAGEACVPLTPNPSDPGYCYGACAQNSDCNSAGASTAWVCDDGVCKCSLDTDCPLGQACDPTSGACYTACSAAANIGCTSIQGVCAEVSGLGYCDSNLSPSAGFTVGAHTGWPAVVNPTGGPVLTAPDIVTVTFNPWQADGVTVSYPYQDQVEAYGQWIASSAWLAIIGADYGISPGTSSSVRLNETPPTVIEDGPSTRAASAFINARITSSALPAPTANTLYVVYFPFSTTIYDGDDEATSQSCSAFLGYHSSGVATDGTPYTYAIEPDCGDGYFGEGNWGVAYDLQGINATTSHEVAEAATDPFLDVPAPDGGYDTSWSMYFSPGSVWCYSGLGGEVADMCLNTLSSHWVDPVSGNVAQRIWSTTAALGNGSPCVPALPGEVFAAVSGPGSLLDGTAGGQVTIPYQAWSTAPTADWQIYLSQYSGGPAVTVTPSTAVTVNNNQSGQFTLTIPSSYASGSLITFELSSYVGPGVDTMWWPVVVYIP